MMTNLSHCLNGRHQTNYQTVPHHPLTPDQRVPQHENHLFSVAWYPCPYACRANCAPVWFSEILLPQQKDHIPMVYNHEQFFSAKTRKRYTYLLTPKPPDTPPPGGMHVVVVGRAQAPPPWETPPTAEIPPYTPQPTPPQNYPLLPPPPPPSFDR